jgi:hypothetical protein
MSLIHKEIEADQPILKRDLNGLMFTEAIPKNLLEQMICLPI